MSHLTQEQRYTISVIRQEGYSQTAIAKVINKNKSVVCRELQRNADGRSGKYDYDLAQRKYAKRQKDKPKRIKFTADIASFVQAQLELKLSPEQIANELLKGSIGSVSTERIYQHIWKDKKSKGTLHTHLRTQGKRYRSRGAWKDKRGTITGRVDIEQRPAIVEARERFGDFEIDTIIGKDHKGAIVTINDRLTGMRWMKKLNGKNALELAQATIELLSPLKPWLKTMTSDNGKEFAEHQLIATELDIGFFFAKPYHSWERGSNENLNGLVRQYIPKKTDFETITDEYVQFVQEQLNNRPRKRFNFISPIQMFNQKVAFVT